MWRIFRIKLVITMIIFAAVIAFVIAIINHVRISDQVIRDNRFQVEQIEATIAYTLNTIDKIYYYFDQETADKMEMNTMELMELYQKNPAIDTWDFEQLYEELGMDLFIIDPDNVIVLSTKHSDIGMDFNECCGKLVKILDERRDTGGFYHDGMDIAQATGEVTKFSYTATPDKEFIIELAYSLQEGDIFKNFNFLNVIDDLQASYPSINEINILNLGGLALGNATGESTLSTEQRVAFEETLKDGNTTEVRTKIDGETAIHRYVPYNSGYDFGYTKNKVIEITYNEKGLQSVLADHRNVFILQLAFILAATIIIALIISKWVSRPMYMAFHDNLTGLRNRGAFEEDLSKALCESDVQTGLLMVDLDHFKSVNDLFGHDKGDELLKGMAKTIQFATDTNDTVYRLGGDEFAILLVDTSRENAIQTAEKVIEELNKGITEKYKSLGIEVTASIGIALTTTDTTDADELYKQADRALYASKERGKNQYQLYGECHDKNTASHDRM